MIELKSDLHLHTCDDREDWVEHTAEELISTAAQKGFKVLSITNHDTFTFSSELERYAADRGILLIPGIEKKIEKKHVLILNAFPAVEKIDTFDDLGLAKEDGIFVIAPHPFFKLGCCLENKLLEHIELFDAIEYSFFYSRWVNLNRKAVELAREQKLPIVGNSDCHLLKYMGICHSIVYADSPTVEDIFAAIRSNYIEVVSKPIPLPKLSVMLLEATQRKYKVRRSRENEKLKKSNDEISEISVM